jgi:hypothetical protein
MDVLRQRGTHISTAYHRGRVLHNVSKARFRVNASDENNQRADRHGHHRGMKAAA